MHDTIDVMNNAVNEGVWNELVQWAQSKDTHPTVGALKYALLLCNMMGSIWAAKLAVIHHF